MIVLLLFHMIHDFMEWIEEGILDVVGRLAAYPVMDIGLKV